MLKQHPLSAAWPAMQPDEFQALKDSIEVVGVLMPITLFDGMVIDGWHRYKASNELGMTCPTTELGDVDPVAFSDAQNNRRNITASQRALSIASIHAWRPLGDQRSAPGSDRGKTTTELAEKAGVSTRTMEQAKVVQARATDEVKGAVKAGKMSVKKAAETVKPKKEKPAKPKAEPPQAEPVEPPKPAPKEYDSDGKAVEEFSELDAANEQIVDLQAALAVASMGDVSASEKTMAADMIAALRKEVKDLQDELENMTRSRNTFQNEAAAAKRQCISLQNQLKRLKK